MSDLNIVIITNALFINLCMCSCLQTKKRFAKEWAEAEKATQQAEKTESDLNATRLDVEKVNTRKH